MEIESCFHEHLLTLCENEGEDDQLLCHGCGDPSLGKSYSCSTCGFDPYQCSACHKRPSGSFYICKDCWPYSPLFHKSCVDLTPEIQITFHPHRIRLLNSKEGYSSGSDFYDSSEPQESGYDDFCEHSGYKFSCDECSFRICVRCVAMLIKYHEGREHIEYFGHRHPLTLAVDDMICNLCRKDIDSPIYGCAPCEFHIHDSCRIEVSQKISHPFHTPHFLTLRENTFLSTRSRCDACCSDIDQFMHYRCDDCEFNLHFECVSLAPNIRYEGHEHLLTLIENMYYQSVCQACGSTIENAFFVRCVECRLNFHVHCGSLHLPEIIMHKHHEHEHSLCLRSEDNAQDVRDTLYCDACEDERNSEHPFYFCAECEYNAHVRCVITEIQLEEKEKLRHFGDRHFLFLLGNNRDDNIMRCDACEKKLLGDPAYGCTFCRFYLHKTCAELPDRKQHPFHQHPLTLLALDFGNGLGCNACHKYCRGFIYHCNDCNFSLDLDCVCLHPSIKIEDHEHILTFFEQLHDVPECKNCKFAPPDASYLRCLECNFNVHLLCAPLPQAIEHWSHQHPITLKDNFMEYATDNEYCCDVCEKRRYARECVYFCAECYFVVDFDCAISEVIDSLESNHGDVSLRTVNKDTISDKVIIKGETYNDILKSYTVEENKILKCFISDIKNELGRVSRARRKWAGSPHWNGSLLQFMIAIYDRGRRTLQIMELKDFESQVVNVRDYIIPQKLESVLKILLDKYGDFGASCNLAHRLKMQPLAIFCGVVQSMSSTMVMDITVELIYTWWCSSEFVKQAGFTIDFVFDHLTRTAEARYGNDAETLRNSPLYELHLETAQLSQKSDELNIEIKKTTAKMAIVREQMQGIISSHRSKASRLAAERSIEALEFRRKNAATGLL